MVDTLTPVDGETDEAGLWLTPAEIARLRGVSRQAISKRVRKLEALGSIATRPGPGETVLVEVAAFDLATHETTPIGEPAAPATKLHSKPPKPQGAASEKVKYEAALKRLEYEERVKKLVPIKQVEDAMVRSGEVIVRAIEHLPNFTAELLAASREGEPAVRRKLREIKDRIRLKAADALKLMLKEGEAQEQAGVEWDLGETGERDSHG
jgi:DNA-binding Lrp family transcriptional regulator